MRKIENVTGIMPFMSVYVELIAGRYQAGVSINGIDVNEMENFDFMTQDGRLPTKFGKKMRSCLDKKSVSSSMIQSRDQEDGNQSKLILWKLILSWFSMRSITARVNPEAEK